MKKISPYIGGLFAIVFVSVIGYLAVHTHLDYFNKKNSSINVYISDITDLRSSNKIVSKKEFNSNNASFDVNLGSIDGKIIYNVEVKNDSIVDVRLDDVSFTKNNGKAIKYNYEDFKVDDVIMAGKSETMKIVLEADKNFNNPKNEDFAGKLEMHLKFEKNI